MGGEVSGTAVVFGDVHGESALLRGLIDESRHRWGQDVAFFGVGDFIDRGKDSKGVIQILIDEGVQGILGNHELWFCQLIKHKKFNDGPLHPIMGGARTLHSYGLGIRWPQKNVNRIPEDHREFFLGLPSHRKLEVGGQVYWLLHAGLGGSVGRDLYTALEKGWAERGLPGTPGDDILMQVAWESVADEMLWNHMKVNKPDLYKFSEGVQVFGHTPLSEPMDGGHFIALDTGAGRSGRNRQNRLSGVALHQDGSREFITVGE